MKKWVGWIACEVAKPCEQSERAAVKAFVYSHRLSIAHCFERWIIRGDVVAELTRLYEDQKGVDPPGLNS